MACHKVVSSSRAAAHPDYSDTWEEYKQKFGKEYQSEDEEVILILFKSSILLLNPCNKL